MTRPYMSAQDSNRHLANVHGFTLLEVMAGLLASAILALTAGIMLFYASRTQQNLGNALSMQRDEQVAMDELMRLTRAGTNLIFSASPPRYTVQHLGRPPAAIYTAGNSLYYDPNTNVANDQVLLIRGTLWAPQFSVMFSNNAARNINTVTLLLVQKVNGDIMSNAVTVTRRN